MTAHPIDPAAVRDAAAVLALCADGQAEAAFELADSDQAVHVAMLSLGMLALFAAELEVEVDTEAVADTLRGLATRAAADAASIA